MRTGMHTVPEPSPPPTPPVPLTALLAREDLALRQIAGPPAAGTVLHGAHTSEMADPYPYLLGGELLLTAGVHIPEAAGSGTYFDDYVSRIVAAGGAALGFGVAPVHDTVPRALVASCETYGLPLLEVPPRTTFAAVGRAVWQLMEHARTAELRRVTEAQQSLAAAASRPDPVPAVLHRLARHLGGRAVLYGPEGAEIAAAGRTREGSPRAHEDTDRTADGSPDALTALARLLVARGSASASDTTPAGIHLTAYALGAGQGFVLGVAAGRRDPGDHTIASVAAVLLSLLTGEQHSGSGAARSSALVRLLLGDTAEDVVPLLGGDRWLVVHARPEERAPDALAASALGAALGSPLVDLAGDVVRVLVPAGREPGPQPGWTLGVSAAVAPGGWRAADTQAARALGRARATRTALVRYGTRAALAELVPPDEAEAHARALLAPLADNPALTETLRTWLSLHGSWDRTAVALSVHRNTVRQRIARCAALLGTDPDDPDVRMELWFALRRAER
ncbi:PucR family transcriptional regulator [Streptomyces antibioticus]|uniref:PucR family transcriptional regulator n=2 Tax=Streptomyces antibioticus TaxID=1890 RepID=UPI002252F121|nr:PucR family transcriptional regulator [Streptomyces antibioticus]MCX4739017.1 PucR family transcriptional regulator [Streptomyces antibioticus]